MLIITRSIGENVIVGNDVIVTVLAVKGNQVKVGISASKEISVYRQEVYERIHSELVGVEDNPKI